MKPGLIIVCGPTATGKTSCAIEIAGRINGEIINADSMQVYREMTIGTAKPTAEEQKNATFHLVDVADPAQTFSTGLFKELAEKAIADIVSRKKNIVVAGGTGLYLKALVHGIFEGPKADQKLRERLAALEKEKPGTLFDRLTKVDSEKAAILPPTDMGRIIRALEVYEKTGKAMSAHQKEHAFSEKKYNTLWFGLSMDRKKLYKRIDDRVLNMIKQGWGNEVADLKKKGFGEKDVAANALGYRTLLDHFNGKCTLEEAIATIQQETRKFAKRQITWFKANKEIHWVEYPKNLDQIIELTKKTLEDWGKQV